MGERNKALVHDIVIGMSDGLVVPFALATGLSFVVEERSVVVIACLAEIAAGAIAMGLGGYFSNKSEAAPGNHHEHSKTYDPSERKAFFANLGLSEDLQQKLAEELQKDQAAWEAQTGANEATVQPDIRQAKRSGINIGLSYVGGGLIPLLPYFFTSDPLLALKVSAPLTLTALFVLGWFKGSMSGGSAGGEALRITMIGLLAGVAAFGVAKIFLEA